VDGVVADGEFIPILGRTPERYRKSKLILSPNDLDILNRLTMHSDVYFVSSRSCQDATTLTRRWLYDAGVAVNNVAGVICNVVPTKKRDICGLLFATYHFDDDPRIVGSMREGVLVRHPSTPGNTEGMTRLRSVKDWWEIEKMCYSAPVHHICFATQQERLELVG
jgi:hypothetical protein